ncbi:MAG: alpha/beta hydrolase [Odoribacteraceae bacterium]|jgi:acetyl esterase/lipase|nr:alpha/beta hydrolase [Odoribacteraceae bacterium]
MKETHHTVFIGILSLLLAIGRPAAAQVSPFEIPLWPDTLPGGEMASVKVFPATGEANGMAVLVCPGGGYTSLSMGHEGEDVARWLADNGVTGIVLRYRLPAGHHEAPLADAQQAMRLIRECATDWCVDPWRVGVMGFSAGGHLSATLLTRHDSLSRPDFGVLFYPVITLDARLTHRGSVRNLLGENATDQWLDYYSNEKHVSPDTPPTLLFHSGDDKSVPPENSLLFHAALRACSVPAALHVFPSGGHGWGFRPSFASHALMKEILLAWLRER